MSEPNPYGAEHQARRDELIPSAIGKPCPICGLPMRAGQRLELDHSTPHAVDRQSKGDRIVHQRCNRKLGNKLGSKLSKFAPSRKW